MRQKPVPPAAAAGRLGVVVVGAGSLSTSLIAGVLAVRRGLGKPIGALTQLGYVAGPHERPAPVPVARAVPLSSLDDLVFGVWDILPDSVYRAAVKARVLDERLLEPLRQELDSIRPWRGIFDPRYVHRIEATHCRSRQGHLANVAEIEKDIASFRKSAGIARLVLLNAASTETYQPVEDIHSDLKLFERALAVKLAPGGKTSVETGRLEVYYPGAYEFLLQETGTPRVPASQVTLVVRKKIETLLLPLMWGGFALSLPVSLLF